MFLKEKSALGLSPRKIAALKEKQTSYFLNADTRSRTNFHENTYFLSNSLDENFAG